MFSTSWMHMLLELIDWFIVVAGIYSPNAYRGFAREFIKDLERLRFVVQTLCCFIFVITRWETKSLTCIINKLLGQELFWISSNPVKTSELRQPQKCLSKGRVSVAATFLARWEIFFAKIKTFLLMWDCICSSWMNNE